MLKAAPAQYRRSLNIRQFLRILRRISHSCLFSYGFPLLAFLYSRFLFYIHYPC